MGSQASNILNLYCFVLAVLPHLRETPPDEQYCSCQSCCKHPVEPDPGGYLGPLIIGTEVPEGGTEQRCGKSTGKKEESDGCDDPHVSSVAMVQRIIFLGQKSIYPEIR